MGLKNSSAVSIRSLHRIITAYKFLCIHEHSSHILSVTVLLQMIQLSYLFFLPPARIRWIWSPLLNAWLYSSLVWNSETNGNQANMATGVKITTPIRYSYPLDKALTEPHIPMAFTTGRHACAICSCIMPDDQTQTILHLQ